MKTVSRSYPVCFRCVIAMRVTGLAGRPPIMGKTISHPRDLAPEAEPGLSCDRVPCSARSVAFIDQERHGPGSVEGSGVIKNLKDRAGNCPIFSSICWAGRRYPQSSAAEGWAVSRAGSRMKRSRQHAVGCAISARSREGMAWTASPLRPCERTVNRNCTRNLQQERRCARNTPRPMFG